jgi:hypothetical protein
MFLQGENFNELILCLPMIDVLYNLQLAARK